MPQTLSEIRSELAARGLRPKHALGQNFLHDQNQLRRLVAAAALEPGALVLEVGPGTGTLTETLLDAGCEVIACELDRDMAAIVRARNADRAENMPGMPGIFSGGAAAAAAALPRRPGRLHLIEADCLAHKHALAPALLQALAGRPFTLVANLPYQAATPLMATLLERHPECRGQFVTIQREVADRLHARAGTDAYGPISVTMALLARVEQIAVLPPGCFWPAPKVTSAMVAVHPRPASERPFDPWDPFSSFVQRTFSQRRKQLGTILGREAVAAAGIDPTRRPETLTPEEWVHLARAVALKA
ncbi:MAG: rRNA adenine dimethyltransferase family protein [Phycisphaerales bacterium]